MIAVILVGIRSGANDGDEDKTLDVAPHTQRPLMMMALLIIVSTAIDSMNPQLNCDKSTHKNVGICNGFNKVIC